MSTLKVEYKRLVEQLENLEKVHLEEVRKERAPLEEALQTTR